MRHVHAGKVRDLYELPDGNLLIVARDTISAFDHILDSPIPDKGRILTQLSLWWFDRLAAIIPNHVITEELPADAPAEWQGRALVVRRLEMVPVECVARGYLAGSGLTEYVKSRTVCGVELPDGLEDGSKLPEAIFTPTTKAPLGEHDEPMTFEQVEARLGAGSPQPGAGENTSGPDIAARLRAVTLDVYRRGAELAAERGIIVADTKIELGWDAAGDLVLGDEVLTPDSSRFWPADGWQPGRAQPSYDKQYVRDWLLSPASGWDRGSGQAPPPLPAEVVERTREKYVEAYERLTGRTFH